MPESLNKKGTLFLVPTPLTPYSPQTWEPEKILGTIPSRTLERLLNISYYVVESEKSATRFLSRIMTPQVFAKISFLPLDEHSTESALQAPLTVLKSGNDCAILSDAGLPCIADPGAALVAAVHRENIPVIPLGNDSSLLMALAASGLNGQKFSFLGYLPVGEEERKSALISEGSASLYDGAARIFIETPYRNAKTIEACKAFLPGEVHLCFAAGLGTDGPFITSMPIVQWKNYRLPVTTDQPAVFCFGLPAALKKENKSRTTKVHSTKNERRSFR